MLMLLFSLFFLNNIKGQNQPDPVISLNVTKIQLGDVLQMLEMKTNFTFSYINDQLPLEEKVSLNVRDYALQKILDILSNKYDLKFTRINTIITVKRNESADKKKQIHNYGTLRGVVRDSLTSENLPYANIYIREINSGASTDSCGYFIIPSIPAPKEYSIIISDAQEELWQTAQAYRYGMNIDFGIGVKL
jgi:hypothetical protein